MAFGKDSLRPAAKLSAALFLPSVLILFFLGQWLLSSKTVLWGAVLYSLGAVLFLLGARAQEHPPTLSVPGGKARRLTSLLFLLILAVWSGALLFYRLGSFPHVLYNWEDATILGLLEYMARPLDLLKDSYLWNPSLMTDTARSLTVGGPILAVLQLFGVDLFHLRIVSAIYGILAVIVTYKLAEEHFGRLVAFLSAILLSTSPVFLLYSRTATIVGPTIFVSLIVVYLFSGALSGKKHYYPLLGVALGISSYYYAVGRLLTLSIVLIVAALLIFRRIPVRDNLRPLLLMVVCLLAVIAPQLTDLEKLRREYFAGRGEHVINMWKQPESLQFFVRGGGDPSQPEVRLRAVFALLQRNLVDYASLYMSVDRSRVFRDYWNSKGEIIPPYLSPFLLLGLLYALLHIVAARYSLLVIWLVVTSLPMVLANYVHAGRLILSIPPMLILTALGLATTYSYLERVPKIGFWASRIVLGAFLLLVSVSGPMDYFDFRVNPQTHTKRIADFLSQRGNDGDVYVFSALQGLRAAELNFYTYNDYSFEYIHNNYGLNFNAKPTNLPSRNEIVFYNVPPSAPQAHLGILNNMIRQRRGKAYLITDDQVYPYLEGNLALAKSLEAQIDFLYVFAVDRGQ